MICTRIVGCWGISEQACTGKRATPCVRTTTAGGGSQRCREWPIMPTRVPALPSLRSHKRIQGFPHDLHHEQACGHPPANALLATAAAACVLHPPAC